jgi:hypothetical protein
MAPAMLADVVMILDSGGVDEQAFECEEVDRRTQIEKVEVGGVRGVQFPACDHCTVLEKETSNFFLCRRSTRNAQDSTPNRPFHLLK